MYTLDNSLLIPFSESCQLVTLGAKSDTPVPSRIAPRKPNTLSNAPSVLLYASMYSLTCFIT